MAAEQDQRDSEAARSDRPEPAVGGEPGMAHGGEQWQQREQALGRRENTADAREEIADRRELAADAREELVDRRELAADAREEIADRREASADAREEQLDTKQRRLAGSTYDSVESAKQTSWEAIARARVLLAASMERLDRSEAALRRSTSREYLQQAEIDRNVAETRRRMWPTREQPHTDPDGPATGE
ncbi:hypothetical protein [Nocardia sp. NPDC051570]|uniref:hypothetical protein n=1 Tax=Nocardia sp. NPDC051570 TaxID=3364324 RepID=UPI0037A232C6